MGSRKARLHTPINIVRLMLPIRTGITTHDCKCSNVYYVTVPYSSNIISSNAIINILREIIASRDSKICYKYSFLKLKLNFNKADYLKNALCGHVVKCKFSYRGKLQRCVGMCIVRLLSLQDTCQYCPISRILRASSFNICHVAHC